MNETKQAPARPSAQNSLIEWFLDEFVPRFGKQSLYGGGGLLIVVLGLVYFNSSKEARQAAENKELGAAYLHFGGGRPDSAEALLSAFLKKSHSRLVQDKANLMLGQIYYDAQKYAEAVQAFGAVDPSPAHPLISSGALHGLAAAHMQMNEYAKAAEVLENFVSKFMRKTGDPSESVAGKEVADLSPVVPNALWKLALCYQQLKNVEKTKSTAEKIVKAYPDSREAFDARRLLAQLP